MKSANLAAASDVLYLSSGKNGADSAVAATSALVGCNTVTFCASGTHTGVSVTLYLKTLGGTWVPVAVVDLQTVTVLASGEITVAPNGTRWWAVKFPPGSFIDAKLVLTSLSTGGPDCEVNAGRTSGDDLFALPTTVATTPQTITSASASALVVGPNGTTNPALRVDAAAASAATGLKITAAAAASGLAVAVISSGTNENLTVDAKGSGTITIGATSTGAVTIGATSQALVVPGPLTRGVGGSTAAAGSSTSDAGALPSGTAGVYPTTGADDTKGVIISTSDKVTGRTLFVGNGVSNKILKVYPPSGGTINGASADVAFSTASGKGAIVVCLSSGGNTWLAW